MPPIIRRTCAFGAKIREILGPSKIVSCCVERDKKILENFQL